MDASDDALARRAQAGDSAAFARIVDRYYDDCLRYACRMLGNRADAEEAVQDAFVRAHRALGRYNHQDRMRGWLFRILVNRCRTRTGRVRRMLGTLARYRELADEPMGWPAAPSENGDAARVHEALARLPTPQREAFLLKHLEDLSYEEMADLTGEGVSALKMRVKRARERLRLELEAPGGV